MERPGKSIWSFLLWLAILVPCLSAAPASAADRWEPLRLWGGDVQLAAAAVDPSVVYAVTPAAGIFRSTDRGATWQFMGYPPDRLEARDLFVDPHDERRLFAIVYAPSPAFSYIGLFRSENGGQTWRRVAIGGSLLYVYEVTFDPETRGVAYAATSRGLFRSRNGGGSWSRIAFEGTPLDQVAVAPSDPDVLLVSVFEGSARTTWRSADGGQTFSQVLPQAMADFVFDPARPQRVYGFDFSSLFVSDDLGATWTTRPGIFTILALAVTPSGVLLSGGYETGVRRSVDEGATWAPRLVEEARPVDHADSLVVLGNRVLAGGARGVWRSDSEGRGWHASSTGLRAQQTTVLEVAGDADSTLWAGTGAGLFQSHDGGASFQGRNGLGPAGVLEVLALHPRHSEIAYAWGCCGENENGVRVGGLIKTEDGGASWQGLPYPGVDREFILVEVDPVNPDIVYAGGAIEPHSGPCTAVRSTDGGATWSCMLPLASRDFTALAIDPRKPQNVFAVAGGELFRSTDRGATWTQVPTSQRGLGRLEVDPSRSERLYALSGNSLLRSDNGGRTWRVQLEALPGGRMWDLLLDPARPGRIWATAEFFELGTYKATSRVFRSDDFGEHWTEVSTGLRAGTVIVELAGDPLSADVIYAGSEGQGLFRLEEE